MREGGILFWILWLVFWYKWKYSVAGMRRGSGRSSVFFGVIHIKQAGVLLFITKTLLEVWVIFIHLKVRKGISHRAYVWSLLALVRNAECNHNPPKNMVICWAKGLIWFWILRGNSRHEARLVVWTFRLCTWITKLSAWNIDQAPQLQCIAHNQHNLHNLQFHIKDIWTHK